MQLRRIRPRSPLRSFFNRSSRSKRIGCCTTTTESAPERNRLRSSPHNHKPTSPPFLQAGLAPPREHYSNQCWPPPLSLRYQQQRCVLIIITLLIPIMGCPPLKPSRTHSFQIWTV